MSRIRDTVVIFGLPGILSCSPADPADPPETESGRAEQTLGFPRRGAG